MNQQKNLTVLHARMMNGTGGGPDKTIINSPRFLKRLDIDCICVFYRPPGDTGFKIVRERAKMAEAKIIEIDDGGIFDFSMIRKTIRICRAHDIDIWHGHDYKTNLLGWIVSKFHKMRLITTAHGWVDYSGRLPTYYKYEKRWILPRYEKVICVSETVMEQAIAGGTPESKCVLIENAIDHEQFSRQRSINEAKHEDFGLSETTFLVGSVGRLSAEKGFNLLIDAVASLIHDGVDLKLVIAGEGPEKESLQQQIRNLGMEEHISLPGFCGNTQLFYESLDLFVLSSHREGLPNVVLEAMAMGTPVLATNVDGVPKIITNGHDGILVAPNSATEISSALSKLVQSVDLRNSLARNAIRTIENRWSFLNRIDRIRRHYI